MAGLAACDPSAVAALADAQVRAVTPDAARRLVSRTQFIQAHARERARPPMHGFTSPERAYYRHDAGPATFLVLDTVNEHGGWEGSLDPDQLDWLDGELSAADADRRYVVVASHHPLETLVNPIGGGRMLGPEVQRVLAAHPSVVLWLAGHTHATSVSAHGNHWQVVAPSLVDWPQQARIVELSRGDGVLQIAATMIDHTGSAPWDGAIDSIEGLAGLSRELSANDPQWRRYAEHPRLGTAQSRNVLLYLPDPFA